jgi:hypothetical protein
MDLTRTYTSEGNAMRVRVQSLLAVFCLAIFAGGAAEAQQEPPDAAKLITAYASTITPDVLEDDMRDLAENRPAEGLAAFQQILDQADDYPEYVYMHDVLGAMVKFFGRDEPGRMFREWLLHTNSEHAVNDIRVRGMDVEWNRDQEWARGLFEEVAREADSEAVRYALVSALDMELTGDELEAYLRSDEGLYEAIVVTLGHGHTAVHNRAGGPLTGGGRLEDVLPAMERILTYHREDYDIFHLHRAMFLWFFDRNEEALADLDAYVNLHPEAPYPYHLRARLLAEVGETDGANSAVEMYEAKTNQVEELTIESPDLPDELPEADFTYQDPRWQQLLDARDAVALAKIVASSNADPLTRSMALTALEEQFEPEELLDTVPWLELAVNRRLLTVTPMQHACQLLATIGQASSAAVISDLAAADPTAPVKRALMAFPADVARRHATWLALQTGENTWFRSLEALYPKEKTYWKPAWELIPTRTPEERLTAASAERDLLGALTLYEMATDETLDGGLRAEAAEALRATPAHALANVLDGANNDD